jgi:hypothetical protein
MKMELLSLRTCAILATLLVVIGNKRYPIETCEESDKLFMIGNHMKSLNDQIIHLDSLFCPVVALPYNVIPSLDYNNTHEKWYLSESLVITSNHYIYFFAKDRPIENCVALYYHIRHTRTVPFSIPIEFKRKQHKLLVLLILSGDVSLNPGPIKYPCGSCYRPVAKNHRAIYCEVCNFWIHIKCGNITPAEYIALSTSDEPWICEQCSKCHFSDSYFDTSYNSINQSNTSDESSIKCELSFMSDISLGENSYDEQSNIFDTIFNLRKKTPRDFFCASLNINSLRNKFCIIKELLTKNAVDLLFLLETKIDDSFPDAEFMVDNYHMWRADRNQHGGGIVSYLRSDIAGDRKNDLEFSSVESIFVEVILDRKKWLICGSYKPPSLCNEMFLEDCSITLDKSMKTYEHIVIIGDLNYNLLDGNKSQSLINVCDIFALENIIKEPTCFTKNSDSSLVDVILTNNPLLMGKHVILTVG